MALVLLLLPLVLLGCTGRPEPQAPTPQPVATARDQFVLARLDMVRSQIRAFGVSDKAVIDAMETVPRHLFVPKQYVPEAYNNYPLPIGEGQTISQPLMVALMTELLALEPGERVLEVGTGSGYQAAILAEIVDEVYSVEIIEPLARTARERLDALGYEKVRTKVDDGYFGWEEFAPYDAIVVTAAPDHVPQPLLAQLKDGGRLVIPVGPPGLIQTLWRIEKRGSEIISHSEGEVRFVPLTRS